MKLSKIRIVGGILLIAFGVLSLLSNLEIFVGALDLFWALLFAAGGALFLFVFLGNREHWWAIIPGFTLISIGLLIAMERFAPWIGGDWGGMLVVGAIGLAFWSIYFSKREHWWAIIPGSVMLTIALIIGFSSALESIGIDTGGVFLLGLGVTFSLIAFLPSRQGQMRWALIPGGILLVMGLLITAAASNLLGFVGPAALILVGLYLIFRVIKPR
ncbi:MAG: hypothetical protein GY832_19380 [Chloroflexi bacterium]|nr:hypothetical protein [Chloroflexota bacterium]